MTVKHQWLMFVFSLSVVIGTASLVAQADTDYRIVAEYPHDPAAFTQGLLFDKGYLYESTGLYGRSSLRQVNIADGKILRQHPLNKAYFGEGLAQVGERLIQLTWKAGKAFVYDRDNFAAINSVDYHGEGWGLALYDRWLVMSDGSNILRWRDPDTFAVHAELPVTEDGRPVKWLNELEIVGGEIWANILGSDRVARIDPATGQVVAWLDLSRLRRHGSGWWRAADLNGMAWNPQTQRLYVTGKRWPVLYELALDDQLLPPQSGWQALPLPLRQPAEED